MKILDLPVMIFSFLDLFFDENNGLTPCYFFKFGPILNENAGLTPCDFFNILPIWYENAGLTRCDFFQF